MTGVHRPFTRGELLAPASTKRAPPAIVYVAILSTAGNEKLLTKIDERLTLAGANRASIDSKVAHALGESAAAGPVAAVPPSSADGLMVRYP